MSMVLSSAQLKKSCAVAQVAMCKALMEGVLSSLEFSWRMLLLPCW